MAMWTEVRFARASEGFNAADWKLTDKGLTYKDFPPTVVATAEMILPPTQWEGDQRASMYCNLTSPEVIRFISDLEAWLLPQLKGDPRHAQKTNLFGESFLRAKIVPETRFHDQFGKRVEVPPGANSTCRFLLSIRPYVVNGTKGAFIRAVGVQAA